MASTSELSERKIGIVDQLKRVEIRAPSPKPGARSNREPLPLRDYSQGTCPRQGRIHDDQARLLKVAARVTETASRGAHRLCQRLPGAVLFRYLAASIRPAAP